MRTEPRVRLTGLSTVRVSGKRASRLMMVTLLSSWTCCVQGVQSALTLIGHLSCRTNGAGWAVLWFAQISFTLALLSVHGYRKWWFIREYNCYKGRNAGRQSRINVNLACLCCCVLRFRERKKRGNGYLKNCLVDKMLLSQERKRKKEKKEDNNKKDHLTSQNGKGCWRSKDMKKKNNRWRGEIAQWPRYFCLACWQERAADVPMTGKWKTASGWWNLVRFLFLFFPV